jgi:hypothetical protein
MTDRQGWQRLISLIAFFRLLERWRATHAMRDRGVELTCSVCFQRYVSERPLEACAQCGGSLPACRACLDAWAKASHGQRRCLICRLPPVVYKPDARLAPTEMRAFLRAIRLLFHLMVVYECFFLRVEDRGVVRELP